MRTGFPPPLRSAALALALVVAACAEPSFARPAAAPSPTPRPVATSSAPAPAPANAPRTAACSDPTASLRPEGQLPKPGAFPAGSYMKTIADRGRLVVGVSQDTPPFGYLNPMDNQIQGFDIDIARQVARAIFGDDGHVEFHVTNPSQRTWVLRDGTVDMVVRTFEATCDAWKQIDFSSTYYDSGERLMVARNAPYQTMQDLAGRKVCAAFGTAALDHVLDAASRPLAVAGRDWTDCLVLFQQGRVDAISSDEPILAGLAAQDQSAKIVGPRMGDDPYAIGVSQAHPEFVRFVNAVLERLRSDGTWTASYNRWLQRFGLPGSPPPARYRD